MTRPQTCPDLETLASFVDGDLEGDARERLVAHLAVCEACYEVLEESLHFRFEDEDGHQTDARAGSGAALPSGRTGIRWPWAVGAVAAAILIALGIRLLGVDFREASSSELVAAVAPGSVLRGLRSEWSGERWEPVRSGQALDAREAYFRVGVRVVDVFAAIAAGDTETATAVASEVESLLGSQGVQGRVAIGSSLDSLAAFGADVDALGRSLGGVEFQFGRWVETGYLAAVSGNREFFDSDIFRDFVSSRGPARESAEVLRQADEVVAMAAASDSGLGQLSARLSRIVADGGLERGVSR